MQSHLRCVQRPSVRSSSSTTCACVPFSHSVEDTHDASRDVRDVLRRQRRTATHVDSCGRVREWEEIER